MTEKKQEARSKSAPVEVEKDGRRIVTIPGFCKGCEICVHLCPTKTLEMKGFKVSVADIGGCNECMLCEMRCPDFAIAIHPSGRRKGKETAPVKEKETP